MNTPFSGVNRGQHLGALLIHELQGLGLAQLAERGPVEEKEMLLGNSGDFGVLVLKRALRLL